MASLCATRYRARSPRATPLFRLFETHFDEVRGQWDERFERRYGFWRSFVDEHAAELLFRHKVIKRIYEVDPLVCPSCGAEMRVIAFITEHDVVDAILRHLECKEAREARGPPS